ncbi:pentapeptide repeat-containing protein [Cellulophaga sp. HaHaR_3_176]|uniref:pentapeptide repeat-containing protein n=1 Tax=Cellulophaga sp. HaHaR_3_176 TaxID=1942464 RepID=UPI00352F103F
MSFNKNKLQEVDFTDCDLNLSVFDNCDLQNAIFKNTNLQNPDLRSSYNFSIDLENNQIKGAKFTLETIVGLLIKYNIDSNF